jgi:hypothetical protein
MAQGPGRYDELATYCRTQAGAIAVLVVVIGGRNGSGFSIQVLEGADRALAGRLPALLRGIAADIEDDIHPNPRSKRG